MIERIANQTRFSVEKELQISGPIDVYKGTYNGLSSILKIFDLRNKVFENYQNEYRSLEILKGISHIPVVQKHEQLDENYAVIIKEYVQGVDIKHVDSITQKQFTEFERHLKKIYRRGISPLDIHDENVLVSYGGQLRLFDFDKIGFRSKMSRLEWKDALAEDKYNLGIHIGSKISE